MASVLTSEATSLCKAVSTGNAKQAEKVARAALAEGTSPQTLLAEQLIPAMEQVVAQFPGNDGTDPELCYVPEQMLVSYAIQAALKVIRPALEESQESNGIRVVIGTMEGDRCDLGRELVALLLRGNHCEVTDLGIEVANHELVRVASEKPGAILVICCRKTSSVELMKQLKVELINCSPNPGTKLLVVGDKITKVHCQQIGADAYTSDALEIFAKVSALAGQ